jgi:hypothetical protein
MALADKIQAQMSPHGQQCRTCLILTELDDVDRTDFAQAVRASIPGSVLARAITERLKEIGSQLTIGAASVRTHIRDHHDA